MRNEDGAGWNRPRFKTDILDTQPRIFRAQRLTDSFDGRRIFQRRHSSRLFKLLGKVLRRAVGKKVSDLSKIHRTITDDVLCSLNLHIIKVFDDAASLFLVEQRLESRAAQGMSLTDLGDSKLLTDMVFQVLQNFCNPSGLMRRRFLPENLRDLFWRDGIFSVVIADNID